MNGLTASADGQILPASPLTLDGPTRAALDAWLTEEGIESLTLHVGPEPVVVWRVLWPGNWRPCRSEEEARRIARGQEGRFPGEVRIELGTIGFVPEVAE